jgi:hypothetical protein
LLSYQNLYGAGAERRQRAEAEAWLEQVWSEEGAFFLDPDPGGIDAANVKGIEDDIRCCTNLFMN